MRVSNSYFCDPEVVRLQSGTDLQDALEDCYSQSGVEDTIVICRSNKRSKLILSTNQIKNSMARG